MHVGDDRDARYHRQMLLPAFGARGQAMLRDAHVAIVGVGALGCMSADLLARAGVGTITLIDRDVVEWTNLQRQSLFDEGDARKGTPKAEAAAARLARVNSQITIIPKPADLDARNAAALLGLDGPRPPSVLIDGADNFETRYLLNDLSVKHAIAYSYAGVVGTQGMQATFVPGAENACLRCLFPAMPAPGSAPTCDTAGVLGPLVAIIAGAQAADVLKILVGARDALSDSMLDVAMWENRRRRLSLRDAKDPACPCCMRRVFDFADADHGGASAALCGQQAVQVQPASACELDLASLATRLASAGLVQRSRFMLRFEPQGLAERMSIFADGRAIVHGTTKPEHARSLYARFVGA